MLTEDLYLLLTHHGVRKETQCTDSVDLQVLITFRFESKPYIIEKLKTYRINNITRIEVKLLRVQACPLDHAEDLLLVREGVKEELRCLVPASKSNLIKNGTLSI